LCSEGRELLKGVEKELELQAMATWMRQHMGVDASDDLADVQWDTVKTSSEE
jgi:hypothetical protein